MRKQSQSSIWDKLIQIMPEFTEQVTKSPHYVDPIAAKSLYNIWRTGSQKQSEKVFKKPVTIGKEEATRMKDAGLIKLIGDNIEITEKGSKVINIMILGDDRSVFEDDGIAIDYNLALDQTKGIKVAKRLKVASTDWWTRYAQQAKYQCKCGEEFDEPKLKWVGDERYRVCPTCGDERIMERD